MRTLVLAVSLLLTASFGFAQSQPSTPTTPPQPVPEIKAGLGPCSVAFHVTDLDGNGVYNAQIHVLVRYGIFHKMDLTAATNGDGRVKFVTLPNKVKQPMDFQISYQGQNAEIVVDPAVRCDASYDVPLKIKKGK